MKYLTSYQIKKIWIDFFISKNHYLTNPVPLVPKDDPSLLWINSGVAGLKKYFDGSLIPPHRRLVNYQRAIRTNDIENVGYTSRHHTLFEMLGNFSIGDYFRKEAIEYAWEILTSTKYYDLDKSLLYFTYHPSDLQTRQCWLDLGVQENHLIPLEGNFWEIGEGPCGPNTEIFYDRGLKYDPDNIGVRLLKEDLENDRYIEIWGIVFSQFNAKTGIARKDYKELPQKNIDTGLGFERLVSIIQNGETNFDTDLFLPIIEDIQKYSNVRYQENKIAYRIVADHLRACVFALADGAVFSNEGRGYVLRRLIRRAIRYLKKLNIVDHIFHKLVPNFIENNNDSYPYLKEKEEIIIKLLKIEEEKFHQTLSKGENLFNQIVENAKDKQISGFEAFKLYDTYGFPIELTVEMAKENGFNVDLEAYQSEMKKQQERARNSRENEYSMTSQNKTLLEFRKNSQFDYELEKTIGKPILMLSFGEEVEQLNSSGEVIFDKTVFYAESGGQVGDTGIIYNDNFKALVKDVKKTPNGQNIHYLEVLNGSLKLNDSVVMELDQIRRKRITRNHSAAHLLQYALKIVLGDHIEQAGSYVDEHKLRFDFSHYEKISKEQLKEIEDIVNDLILKSINSKIDIMSIDDAKNIGATMLFTEKYGKEVRVVNFGDLSIELCGGCHVSNSADIGIFAIESEGSISSGIRRIEAHVHQEAYKMMSSRIQLFENAAKILETSSIFEVEDKVKSLKENQEILLKKNESNEIKLANFFAEKLIESVFEKDQIKLVIEKFQLEKNIVLKIGEILKQKLNQYCIILVAQNDNIVNILAFASPKAIELGYDSNAILKQMKEFNIRGGGKKEFAQGGGNISPELDDYLKKCKKMQIDIIGKHNG